MSRRALQVALLVVAAILPIGESQAAAINVADTTPGVVLYDEATGVSTSSLSMPPDAFDSTTPINVPGPGELYVTLTDQNSPSFASLQFALTDSDTTLVPLADAGVVESIDLSQAQVAQGISVNISGATQDGYGLYSLEATLVPQASVPLPPPAWVLLSSLVCLLGLSLRGKPCSECNTMAIPYA